MAERIVSPGVFTQERDQTFLAQGVAEIGAAFVGPTTKGPAFIPTLVRGIDGFVTSFGEPDGTSYMGYAAKNYLQEAGSATIVRVLGLAGYSTNVVTVFATGSAGQKVFAVLHPTTAGQSITNVTLTGTTDDFDLEITGSISSLATGLSVVEGTTSFISNYYGTNPVSDTSPVYTYAVFPDAVSQARGTETLSGLTTTTQSVSFADVNSNPTYVDTGSLRKFAVPLASFTNPDTTYLSTYIPSGSGTDFAANVLSQFTAVSGSNIVFIVNTTANAVLNSVVYTTTVQLTAVTSSLDLTTQYDNATTPWIRSQAIGGTTKHNLFKVHTLGDGNASNTDIKISITGISPSLDPDSEYGSFSLLVRDFNDTDTQPNVLETWSNLNLNPDSPNYIARVIGNSAPVYDSAAGETYYEGDYPNNSNYIRIEMSEDVIPENAVPYGFAALNATVSSSAGQLATGSYVTSRWLSGSTPGYNAQAVGPNTNYYGFDFSDTTSLSYIGPIVGTQVAGTEFNLGDSWSTTEVNGSPILLSDRSHVTYRRFTVPLQGGFDGLKPNRVIAVGSAITATNTQGFDLSTINASGSVEYKRALRALSNPDSVDMNLLVVPGAIHTLHSPITQTAIDICEARGDCFFILDLAPLTATIDTVTQAAEALDTNYAAAYYPWVRVVDTNTNKFMWAPPSVVLPEVYKYNDNVGAEWFAPAGLNRGGIPGAVGVKARLNQSQRDELYESKVNPIAQFPGQGICVWGQKTLQRRASALDRVNVRRLLITVKKFIASSARYLVFEQNTEATRTRFLNIVNPYLAGIQQNSGLTAFRVVMDETNNTPDLIDRNILKGAIYLQPTRTAEFIMLDFNILPTGASFDTI